MGLTVGGGESRSPRRPRVDFEVGGAEGVLFVSLCVSNVVPSVSVMMFRRLEINRSVCRVSSVISPIRDLSFSQASTAVSTKKTGEQNAFAKHVIESTWSHYGEKGGIFVGGE